MVHIVKVSKTVVLLCYILHHLLLFYMLSEPVPVPLGLEKCLSSVLYRSLVLFKIQFDRSTELLVAQEHSIQTMY